MIPNPRFNKKVTRRDFLGTLAIGACIISFFSAILSLFKFPLLRSYSEPSKVYRIGDPSKFKMGEVTYLKEHKIYVVHNEKGLFAISAICTHLGCLVKDTGTEFLCPCHGSKFDIDGNVISGPAPRALEWYGMFVDSTDQLVVNANDVVQQGTYFNV